MSEKPAQLSGRALAESNLRTAEAFVPTNDYQRKMRALNIEQITAWIAALDRREAR
jgi:hypothetical protein